MMYQHSIMDSGRRKQIIEWIILAVTIIGALSGIGLMIWSLSNISCGLCQNHRIVGTPDEEIANIGFVGMVIFIGAIVFFMAAVTILSKGLFAFGKRVFSILLGISLIIASGYIVTIFEPINHIVNEYPVLNVENGKIIYTDQNTLKVHQIKTDEGNPIPVKYVNSTRNVFVWEYDRMGWNSFSELTTMNYSYTLYYPKPEGK